MHTILIAVTLAIISSCNASSKASFRNHSDTVLLYKKDTLLISSFNPSVVQCQFSASTREKYNSRLKTLLLLENPKLLAAPDGVYEVYMTCQPPDIYHLSPSQTGFITVLDLYTLTAPATKDRLELDISELSKKIFLQKQSPLSAYISIRFGPIKLPDGNYSSKAGELQFTGFRIVQIKE